MLCQASGVCVVWCYGIQALWFVVADVGFALSSVAVVGGSCFRVMGV